MSRDFAPAAERNKEPIREVLATTLPPAGVVLEVAAGTGQHAVHMAGAFPHLSWKPTDLDPDACDGIRAGCDEAGLENLLEPCVLDVRDDDWPVQGADAIVCVNMIHISPWASCEGLMAGAGRLLGDGAVLFLYGPYRVDGELVPESNVSFDESLRRMDPAWGVRELRNVEAEAAKHGFGLEQLVAMPANNYSVIFRKSAPVRAAR